MNGKCIRIEIGFQSKHQQATFSLLFLIYLLFHGQVRLGVMRKSKGKVKAIPLQSWSGPEGSRKLRFPDYFTTA
jgi:hypothetical protein